MSSIVLELQELAQDSNSNIKDLLMKSLIVAKKLKIKDFEDFVESELKGYQDTKNLPEYRKVKGTLKANFGYGLIPVMLPTTELEDLVTSLNLFEPICNFQDLLGTNDNFMYTNLKPEQKEALNQLFQEDCDYHNQIPKTSISNILNSVRVLILEWSIKLEEDGILGENMRFTKEEKDIANQNAYTVNNYINNFHKEVTNSQIQQHSTSSSQTISNNEIKELETFISIVRSQLDKTQLDKDQIIQVNETLSNIERELKSTKPNKSIIAKGLNFIKEVCTTVTTDLAAMGIVYGITQLLG